MTIPVGYIDVVWIDMSGMPWIVHEVVALEFDFVDLSSYGSPVTYWEAASVRW